MRHVILLVAVCCFSAFSFSQTADELIAKNIQAKGGIEKIKAIKTLRMTGKFEGGGFTAAVISVCQPDHGVTIIAERFSLAVRFLATE